MNSVTPTVRDHHSYATPETARVRHLSLDLAVDFSRHVLAGSATWTLDRKGAGPLVLDTRGLKIGAVEVLNGASAKPVQWTLGKPDAILGAPLSIELPEGAGQVRIQYETSPDATALQWLAPAQTTGKKQPFLFTQAQAIHARSFVPCQDSPGIRITFDAHIRTPKELVAVMGAEMDPRAPGSGEFRFRMKEPIPSYLLALAVGDLEFRPISNRTGVYAEPSVAPAAAKEFEDLEKMVVAAERLYGPYRWGRYDVLVLPPSFPFGGMENPRLTFATPTILAGDKSLVSLIAHELAHSWAGNLVTNATWSDFWLNEGFTVYLERRILNQVYGDEREAMEAVLGRQDLEKEMAGLAPRDQVLHIDLKGRDPDDGATLVPYEKGCLLLSTMALSIGTRQFDDFLRNYFDHFAFQSITTDQAMVYFREALPMRPGLSIEDWLNKPGIPEGAFQPQSASFGRVDTAAKAWQSSPLIESRDWSTQEWLHFLRALPSDLGAARMAVLDQRFHLTRTGNDEILEQWLEMAIQQNYTAAYPRLEEFLSTVGRRKYLKPLYEALVKTEAGRKIAERVYAKARPAYHPIAQATVDQILAKK